ncbi:hypothetical protein [Actinophytocola sediminis]
MKLWKRRPRTPRHALTSEPRDVVGWLDQLKADPAAGERTRADIADAMAVFAAVTRQRIDCSCTGRTVIVIHDPGAMCGSTQWDAAEIAAQDAAARTGSGPDEMPLIQTAAYAVLDHLTSTERRNR